MKRPKMPCPQVYAAPDANVCSDYADGPEDLACCYCPRGCFAEASDAIPFILGGKDPSTLSFEHWRNHGDIIRLTENCFRVRRNGRFAINASIPVRNHQKAGDASTSGGARVCLQLNAGGFARKERPLAEIIQTLPAKECDIATLSLVRECTLHQGEVYRLQVSSLNDKGIEVGLMEEQSSWLQVRFVQH